MTEPARRRIHSANQALLAGAAHGGIAQFVAVNMKNADVRFQQDRDGNFYPYVEVAFTDDNGQYAETVHTVVTTTLATENEFAATLAEIAERAGKERVARLLRLITAGEDDDTIAKLA